MSFIDFDPPAMNATWWPSKAPGEDLIWSENMAPYLNPGDVIETVAASIAPFGAGELTATSISVIGQVIGLTLSGGQPRRVYTVQLLVAATNGNVYQPTVNIRVRPLLPTDQPQVAPVPGFGTAIYWNGGVVSTAVNLAVSGFISATGTSQATGATISAVTSIVNVATTAADCIVMPPLSGVIAGTLQQTNITRTDVQLYPWPGDSFIGYATDAPVTLPAGGSYSETLVQGATAWALASL